MAPFAWTHGKRSRAGVLGSVFLMVASLGLAACGGDPAPSSADASFSSTDYPQGGDAAFNTKWTDLLAAAKKEGELVILDGPNVATGEGPVYDAFGKAYGIKVTHVTGSADQIVSRVLAERQQQIYSVDLAMAGGGGMKRLIDAKVFQPLAPQLISPEAVDRSTGWPIDYIPYNPDDRDAKFVTSYSKRADANYVPIWYNTDKVTPDVLDKVVSWDDLLNPTFKGKFIIGDVANDAATNDRVLSWIGLGGSGYWDKFIRQMDPTVSPVGSSRDLADALARGQFDFAMFLDADAPLISAQEDGLPVAPMQKALSEGGPISPGGNLAIFDRPAHPAAAQLFSNWLLSKQGQTAYNAMNKNSDNVALRTDVPQGGIADGVWARATDTKTKFIPLDDNFAKADEDSSAWWKQTFNELKLGAHS